MDNMKKNHFFSNAKKMNVYVWLAVAFLVAGVGMLIGEDTEYEVPMFIGTFLIVFFIVFPPIFGLKDDKI